MLLLPPWGDNDHLRASLTSLKFNELFWDSKGFLSNLTLSAETRNTITLQSNFFHNDMQLRRKPQCMLWLGCSVSPRHLLDHSKECWDNLEKVSVPGTKLDTTAVRELGSIIYLTERLTELNMSNTELSKFGLGQFSLTSWAHLQKLDVSYNTLGLQGAQLLVQTDLPALVYLNLEKVELVDEAFVLLAQGKWPQLQSLNMSNNSFSGTAACHIDSNHWPHLAFLHLPHSCFRPIRAWVHFALPDPTEHLLNLENIVGIKHCLPLARCHHLADGRWPHLSRVYVSRALDSVLLEKKKKGLSLGVIMGASRPGSSPGLLP